MLQWNYWSSSHPMYPSPPSSTSSTSSFAASSSSSSFTSLSSSFSSLVSPVITPPLPLHLHLDLNPSCPSSSSLSSCSYSPQSSINTSYTQRLVHCVPPPPQPVHSGKSTPSSSLASFLPPPASSHSHSHSCSRHTHTDAPSRKEHGLSGSEESTRRSHYTLSDNGNKNDRGDGKPDNIFSSSFESCSSLRPAQTHPQPRAHQHSRGPAHAPVNVPVPVHVRMPVPPLPLSLSLLRKTHPQLNPHILFSSSSSSRTVPHTQQGQAQALSNYMLRDASQGGGGCSNSARNGMFGVDGVVMVPDCERNMYAQAQHAGTYTNTAENVNRQRGSSTYTTEHTHPRAVGLNPQSYHPHPAGSQYTLTPSYHHQLNTSNVYNNNNNGLYSYVVPMLAQQQQLQLPQRHTQLRQQLHPSLHQHIQAPVQQQHHYTHTHAAATVAAGGGGVMSGSAEKRRRLDLKLR